MKIDEGAFSHLTTDIHQNRTIWHVVQADPHTGDFDTTFSIPDGTLATSEPAMPKGAHTLRLLTGTLKPGDITRTMLSPEFTVGEYTPSGTPRPPEVDEDLTTSTANGATVELTDTEVVVRVPSTAPGDWAFLTVFDDMSPRYPWGATWFRVGGDGAIRASRAGVVLPAGSNKLAVHSDARDQRGDRILVGWATLNVAAPAPVPSPTPAPTPTTPAPAPEATAPTTVMGTGSSRPSATAPKPGSGSSRQSSSPRRSATTTSRPTTTAPSVATSPAPDQTPSAPALDGAGLSELSTGPVTGVLDGKIVTLSTGAPAGSWVFVYLYSEPVPLGWLRVSSSGTVRVDLSNVSGAHKLAVLDEAGTLVGWAEVDLGAESDAQSEATSDGPSASPGERAAGHDAAARNAVNDTSTNNGPLIVVALAILLVAGIAVTIIKRRGASPSSAT